MFSFAKNLVKTLEHSAESIITGGPNDNSILDNDSYFANTKGNKYGFRIINIKPNSKASELDLQSWFDYIIGINGHELPTNYDNAYQLIPNYEYFIKEIENCKNRSITLEIWSAKGGVSKSIEIPINDITNSLDDIPLHSSNIIVQQSFEKVGLQIQWTPLITSTFVYHILDIHPNSPAEKAGLLEHSDYIIGAQDGLLATGGEDLLGRLVQSKLNNSLVLYVYNHDYDVVRPVTIYPVDNWGGNGYLGSGVGYGFLHRIPPSLSNFEPGSVLFDDGSNNGASESKESFHQINPTPVPVFTAPQTSSIVPPPIHGRKKKTNSVKPDLLDYLQEEGEKSRKLDSEGRSTYDDTTGSLPPPPKK